MADLTVTAADLDGLDLTTLLTAAAAAGDAFANDGKTILVVDNANVATRTITIDSVVNCSQGFDHNAGGTAVAQGVTVFGPFPINRFNDVNGKVQVTYSTEVDLTVAAVKVV